MLKFILQFISYVLIIISIKVNPIINGEDAGVLTINLDGQIVGTTDIRYPFIVHIIVFEPMRSCNGKIHFKKIYCGGVILTESAVLTAAHCLSGTITKSIIHLRAGLVHLKYDWSNAQFSEMSDYIINEGYIENYYIKKDLFIRAMGDIAIIWLKKPFIFDETVKKAILMDAEDKSDYKTGKIIGWGKNSNGVAALMLQQATIQAITIKNCQKFYKMLYLTSDVICLLSQSRKSTLCEGDSGGPFVVDGKIYGIASYVNLNQNNECDPTVPGIYSHIGMYRDWIDEKLEKRINLKMKMKKRFYPRNKCDGSGQSDYDQGVSRKKLKPSE